MTLDRNILPSEYVVDIWTEQSAISQTALLAVEELVAVVNGQFPTIIGQPPNCDRIPVIQDRSPYGFR